MKGNIKMAMVSLKYKKKGKGRVIKIEKTPAVQVLIVVKEWEGKRVLKFKKRVIGRVIRELNISKAVFDKMVDPDINSIEIIKDVGRTTYDV